MSKTAKERIKLWRTRHPGIEKERKHLLRIKILTHYGGGKLSCIRCGFNDIRALSLDHINGREMSDITARIKGIKIEKNLECYRRLIRENYPEGYQTLCMNCQWIKRFDNKEYS
jgi:hypothetical protein